MIVWGGNAGTASTPAGATTPPPTPGADLDRRNVPSAREYHTAVWTGSEMIVWGGTDGTASNTGGRYNPSTDSWLATSTGARCPPRVSTTPRCGRAAR